MDYITKTFEYPKEIRLGVDSGRYQLLGGVARDNEGQIVKMLKEVYLRRRAPTNVRAAIFVAIGIGLAGGAYALYRCLSMKERTRSQLLQTDAAIIAYDTAYQRHQLRVEQVEALYTEFRTLLESMTTGRLTECGLELTLEQAQMLRALYQLIESINASSHSLPTHEKSTPAVPDVEDPAVLVQKILSELGIQMADMSRATPPQASSAPIPT